jgi:hypothetical protein
VQRSALSPSGPIGTIRANTAARDMKTSVFTLITNFVNNVHSQDTNRN